MNSKESREGGRKEAFCREVSSKIRLKENSPAKDWEFNWVNLKQFISLGNA